MYWWMLLLGIVLLYCSDFLWVFYGWLLILIWCSYFMFDMFCMLGMIR